MASPNPPIPLPWESGFFEEQAKAAAAAVGQVVQDVSQAIVPVAAPIIEAVAPVIETAVTELPIKKQVKIDPTIGTPVTVETKIGSVSFWDKVKGAYKWIIAFIGFLLVVLNQVLVFNDLLPQNVANWITIAITFLTSVSVFLKSNEHWVEGGVTVVPS